MRGDYCSVYLLRIFGILCSLLNHLQHSSDCTIGLGLQPARMPSSYRPEVEIWRRVAGAIQCYSCKATASNEIEANVRCLETANLEDCSDFYQYYSEIETGGGNDVIYEYDYPEIDASFNRKSAPSREVSRRRGRFRRQAGDYSARGDYQYPDESMTSSTTSGAPSGERHETNSSNVSSERQMSLPTDPEHHCYSTAKKNRWESYTVEKGCKKIAYCRAHRENMPSVWTLPWNFCCDRSRCNAKLVKDKPQRIFAMGCRRTDDCIQGHITRHVCPKLYQSCPRVSSSVIKMECRVRHRQGHSPAQRAPIYGSAYFNQFKDKKCFCARGYYPRGPICSGANSRIISEWFCISVVATVYITLYFLTASTLYT